MRIVVMSTILPRPIHGSGNAEEVAKRLGHSVETLVSIYVGALGGDEAIANRRIEAHLSSQT